MDAVDVSVADSSSKALAGVESSTNESVSTTTVADKISEAIGTPENQPTTPATPVTFASHRRHPSRSSSWNFIWQKDVESSADAEQSRLPLPIVATPSTGTPSQNDWVKRKETTERPRLNGQNSNTSLILQDIDLREQMLERRERESDRKEREYDRRERELERRERELERRQREYERDRARWTAEVQVVQDSGWQRAFESLKNEISLNFLAERKKLNEREGLLHTRIMNQVNEVLEKERQLYGVMRMSDHEVTEMMESSVGYLLQNDEEIADRVRFQSLLYLSQERLASEAGLTPPPGSDSLSLAWRLALGPSVVTEDRYNKALELLANRDLDQSTKRLLENKKALEYTVEYTSHLRREGSETSEYSFSLGRIPREDYMESVRRHSAEGLPEYEALKALVDFISPVS